MQISGGGGVGNQNQIPSMGNMEATSFFAQLRRGKHGPIPRERSPSPVPGPEIVTIGDDQSNSNNSITMIPPNENKDSSSDNKPVINNSSMGLMNLPFPPGMEGINKKTALLPPHVKLYDNLLGASEALKSNLKNQKVVSITRDLPMPPGKNHLSCF
jgi:hypothetical protein